MIDETSLAGVFPTDAKIPTEHRLAGPIHQRTYVIDGLLASWSGEVKTVLSPVCTRQADGSITQVEIGSYPVMGVAESDQILQAAVAAYDNGRGAWPTMSVAGRIDCMQEFVRQMAAQRDLVVKLIMWEIGKSLADSRKEFDRTVEYIQATIVALKDLDNGNSRFVVVVGANLFFQLISRRYERGPMILTSNQSFGAWGEVFGDRVIATAILDRLLHQAVTLNIRGNSYRLKEKLKAGLVRSHDDSGSQLGGEV